jgi:hypothetical protein
LVLCVFASSFGIFFTPVRFSLIVFTSFYHFYNFSDQILFEQRARSAREKMTSSATAHTGKNDLFSLTQTLVSLLFRVHPNSSTFCLFRS